MNMEIIENLNIARAYDLWRDGIPGFVIDQFVSPTLACLYQ